MENAISTGVIETQFVVQEKITQNLPDYHKYEFDIFTSRLSSTEFSDLEQLFASGLPMPDANKGVWIAGGAIRRMLLGDKIDSDVDYFFRDEEALKTFQANLEKESQTEDTLKIVEHKENQFNHLYIIEIDNGRKIKLQLITINFYKSAEEILDSFDFTICQFAYDGEYLYCGQYSLMDLYRKRLVVHKITFAVASLRRIIKYANQGFYFCSGAATKFLNDVVNQPDTLTTEVKYID